MMLFECINRTKLLHKLITQECTGTPDQLAQRFHLSKRQLYNLLEEFKEMGADIGYSRMKETFYYKNDFYLELSFKVSILSSNEEKTIRAGISCYNAILLHGSALPLSS